MEKFDVVFFFGPPHVGKTKFYEKNLKDTHERVCPCEIFQRHPDWNLRKVALEVVSLLNQGKKVVIDDENWSASTRTSYVNLINRKIPGHRFVCVKFEPEHGKQQLCWAREFQLVDQEMKETCMNLDVSDQMCERWFEEEDEDGYNPIEKPDIPEESEGFEVQTVSTVLEVSVCHKFEVPALLVEWEGLVLTKDGSACPAEGATDAIKLWYDHSPCGRVIVIHDGQGLKASAEVKRDIKQLLAFLSKQIDTCPVYIHHVCDHTKAGQFVVPPQPGIVAFIQRHHLLDLKHKASVYLYQSVAHKDMAVSAGIQHIKASRVFSHPRLVISNHALTKPGQTPLLKSIKVTSRSVATSAAQIPWYEETLGSSDSICELDLGHGRCVYVAAKDQEVLQRYQQLYEDNATPVGDVGSRIADLSRQLSATPASISTQQSPRSLQTLPASTTDKPRDLPKWMLPKEERKQKRPFLSHASSSIDDSSLGSGVAKTGVTTVYVMSEEELEETARLILTEAGRRVPSDEAIALHLSRQDREAEPDRGVLSKESPKKTEKSDKTTTKESSLDQTHIDTHLPKSDRVRVPADPSKREPAEEATALSVLDDIFGGENGSSKRGRRAPKRQRHHVPESPSYMSQQKVASGVTILDSLVPETVSQHTRRSLPDISIPDSHVPETASEKKYLPEKLLESSTFSQEASTGHFRRPRTSTQKHSVSSSVRVPDSFVAETVTTVPETVFVETQRKKSRTESDSKPEATDETRKSKGTDFSFLDDLF